VHILYLAQVNSVRSEHAYVHSLLSDSTDIYIPGVQVPGNVMNSCLAPSMRN